MNLEGITYAECLGDGCDLCAAGFTPYSDSAGDERTLPFDLSPKNDEQRRSLEFAISASWASWNVRAVHVMSSQSELDAVRP